MKRSILLISAIIILSSFLISVATADTQSINLAQARQYFSELKRISDADGGKLWGVTLYGPVMFIDPQSRLIVANRPDHDGKLTANDSVYTGIPGAGFSPSNTAMTWSGTFWTAITWNALSEDDQYDRARLMVHECWHRIQKEIGIPAAVTSNTYLDDVDGRVSMLLEFRALSRALLADRKSEQTEAISNALTIRKYRQSQFPNNNENAFERHEGLAEYTGLKLCGLPDSMLIRIAAKKLQLAENKEGLANSFAYLTGPALGLLLDRYDDNWHSEIRNGSDLPTLLAAAIDWPAPDDNEQLKDAAKQIGIEYGAAALLANEKNNKADLLQVIDEYRNRLASRGQLLIPNDNLQFSFNPQEKLIVLDTMGVIYKTMRLTGEFGVLDVTDGILRTNDWQTFIVPVPDTIEGNSFNSDGYKLQLNPGWQIEDKGNGIFIVKNSKM
jgi:hypothetical protein